jgi:hypothetical protein
LEKWKSSYDKNAPEIQQITPDMVWLEVNAASKKKPSLVNWNNDGDIAAPAFRLRADNWPIQEGNFEPSRLQAWWTESPHQVDGLIQKGAGWRGSMLPEQAPIHFAKLGVATDVNVSLTVEKDRLIEVAPKRFEKQTCLVFRVEHPVNQPVWIRWKPAGLRTGEEHRYFSDAGQYTAMFYPYDKVNLVPETFEIFCLTSFKKEAMFESFTPSIRIEPPAYFSNRLDRGR